MTPYTKKANKSKIASSFTKSSVPHFRYVFHATSSPSQLSVRNTNVTPINADINVFSRFVPCFMSTVHKVLVLGIAAFNLQGTFSRT